MKDSYGEYRYEMAIDRNLCAITHEEQERLRNATVAQAGLGGIGGTVAQLLTRAGVGHIKAMDADDSYDITNLNRQLFAFLDTIGISKADSMLKFLPKINPTLDLVAIKKKVTTIEDVYELIKDVQHLIATVDDPALNYIMCDIAIDKDIPVTMVSPYGWRFWLTTVMPDGPTCEEMMKLPRKSFIERLKEKEVMAEALRRYQARAGGWTEEYAQKYYQGNTYFKGFGPMVAILASWAALEVIKTIIGRGKVYTAPEILAIDLLSGENWEHEPWKEQGEIYRMILTNK